MSATKVPCCSMWELRDSRGAADRYTTIGNWKQPYREIEFQGRTYHWTKHLEFMKIIDLPKRRPNVRFELGLASYDDETVCVYQAYRASIAECAVRDQRLGEGGFSFERMSWKMSRPGAE